MQDPLETIVGEALSTYPVPTPSSTAISDVLAAGSRYERSRSHEVQWTKRALLISYWACASIASLVILLSVPLPHWKPGALTTWTAWAIPSVGALWLGRASMVRALRDWGTRYLPGTYVSFVRTR